jgi:hypothetical protein
MMKPQDIVAQQREVCRRYEATPYQMAPDLKVGISKEFRRELPINGIRHQPEGQTTGWYIWTGELSDDPEFFVPLHWEHLIEACPEVVPYLLLPPGYRFLLARGYEDVWFDRAVLEAD